MPTFRFMILIWATSSECRKCLPSFVWVLTRLADRRYHRVTEALAGLLAIICGTVKIYI